MKKKCKDCIFFVLDDRIGFNIGNCQRYPPTVCYKGKLLGFDTEFPQVIATETWCGEFKDKKTKE